MATKALSFDVGDYVVYPKHGVGRVVELQSTEIAGTRLDLYVLRFAGPGPAGIYCRRANIAERVAPACQGHPAARAGAS